MNIHNGLKSKEIERINVEREYPEIYNYLKLYLPAIKDRTDKGNHWTNLRNCAYMEEFDKPKIIYPNMTKFLPFVYDKGSFYTNQKCFIITGNYLGYLTAFLNSKLFKYCFRDNFPELQGGTRELSKIFFDKIPVKKIDNNTELIFLRIVEDIQKNKDKNISTNTLEADIENRLGILYNLTDEEMLIINNS